MNFAIIGSGAIGRRHAAHCAAIGKLLAVCDIVPEKALDLANTYQAKAYTRIEDLLDIERDVEVVAVCTPNGLHADHSIKALQAGFHVICEKPMALHASDCSRMIEAAEKADRQLFVVKQNRFNPPVAAVKKMLDANRLGRIYSIQLNCFWNRTAKYYKEAWRGTLDLDGGILYTQFSHFVDLLYWMLGDIKDLYAFADNFAHQGITAFEDTCVVGLRLGNGALGTIHFTTNSYHRNMEGSLTIFAEKGTVKIGGQYLNELTYQQTEDQTIDGLPCGSLQNDYGSYQGSMSNHDKIYSHVVEVLTKNTPNRFTGHDGQKTVEIIERIYAASGRVSTGPL